MQKPQQLPQTPKGCILWGNRSQIFKAENWESTGAQYGTEKLALTKAKEKLGKVTMKKRNMTVIMIKWKNDLKQVRHNQLKKL